jgi:Zn-finger nucleic acid-binding protein
MKCPKCTDSTLKNFNLPGNVDVDFCEECKGLWFEKGEVGSYAKFSTDIPNFKQIIKDGKKTGINCPVCGNHELVEVKYSPDSDLLIDYCSNCGGTWFDGGELNVLDTLSEDLDNMKLRLGRAVFEMREKMGKTDIKKCPKCKTPTLNPFKTSENVEVDFCSKCKGIWLEKGETADYVEASSDIPELEKVLKAGRVTDCICPNKTCNNVKLVEIKYSTKHDLLIDYCPQCEGIWLDSGEISTLETIAASEEGAAQKLGRVYANLEKSGYRAL